MDQNDPGLCGEVLSIHGHASKRRGNWQVLESVSTAGSSVARFSQKAATYKLVYSCTVALLRMREMLWHRAGLCQHRRQRISDYSQLRIYSSEFGIAGLTHPATYIEYFAMPEEIVVAMIG